MAMIYKAVGGRARSLPDDQLQAAGKAIDQIKAQNGGVCPPEDYIEAARSPDSPIHDTVPWNDYELAEAQRREVARDLIQMIVRVPEQKQPEWVNVSVTTVVDDVVVRGYVGVDAARRSERWQEQVEHELLGRIKGDCRNHSWLTSAQKVLNFIEWLEQEQAKAA